MVILDKLQLSSKKIIILISFSFLLFLLLSLGMFYIKSSNDDSADKLKKQKIQRELKDQDFYTMTIQDSINSPDINSLIDLFGLIYRDKLFFETSGWIQNEVQCNNNVCNIRYKKEENKLFKYIILTKNKVNYEPIFNEEELTYQDIVYPIDMKSNDKFENKLKSLKSCTDFISETYNFNSLLYNKNSELKIEMPSNIFSFSTNYTWAENIDLKKGEMSFKTKDILYLNYLQEKYSSELIHFNNMMLKDNEISLTLTYYCF